MELPRTIYASQPRQQLDVSTSGRSQLSIIQWNCQKSWSRVLSFFNNKDQGSPDELYAIVALQEPLPPAATDKTRANIENIPDDISNHFELVLDSSYREEGRNPRVCYFVNKRLKKTPWCGWDHKFVRSDVITVELHLPLSSRSDDQESSIIFIHNVYLEPTAGGTAAALDQLKQALEKTERSTPTAFRGTQDHIVLGDMNIRSSLWGEPTTGQDQGFYDFIPIVERLNLTLLLPRGTITRPRIYPQKGSTIDLVFASFALSERLVRCRPRPELGGPDSKLLSDHVPVETILDLTLTERMIPERRLWKNLATDSFINFLRRTLPSDMTDLYPVALIDSYAERLVEAISESIKASTPVCRPSRFSNPWWTEDFRAQLSKARRLRRQVKKSKKWNDGKPDPRLEEQWRRERNAKSRMSKKLQKQDTERLLSTVVGNKSQYEKQARLITLRRHVLRGYAPVGSPYYYNADAGEALLRTFFPGDMSIDLSDIMAMHPASQTTFQPLTVDEVEKALDYRKHGTAPGPDGIPYEVLKLAKPLILPQLVHLFQQSIVNQYCPSHFRHSLTFVHRRPNMSDYTTPEAYEPIVMRNTLSKLLESVIASRISHIIKTQGLLSPNHCKTHSEAEVDRLRHAFLKYIHSAWSMDFEASLLMLDAPKGFENVSHVRLVDILRTGFPVELVGWIESFLSQRRTSFQIPGHEMDDSCTLPEFCCSGFGLPRGSPLSDVLYALYTASLPRPSGASATWLSFNGSLGILTWSKTTSESCEILKAEIHRLEQWMLKYGSVFDMESPQLIHFVKDNKSTETVLRIGNNFVRPSPSVLFLGVLFDSKLSWQPHRQFVAGDVSSSQGFFHSIAKYSKFMNQSGLADIFYMNILSPALRGCNLWYPDQEDRYFRVRRQSVNKLLASIQARSIPAFFGDNSDNLSTFGAKVHLAIPPRHAAVSYHDKLMEMKDLLAIYTRGYRTTLQVGAVACSVRPSERQWQTLNSAIQHVRSLDLFSELCGIAAALKLASNLLNGNSRSKVIIFSNSQDAIRYMSCPVRQRHPVLFDLITQNLRNLLVLVDYIRLVWIPSKTGIPGNVYACQLVQNLL